MPATDTPLRYPGGKTQLSPFVIELLRENDLFYGEYIEPFAGGAGIACKLLVDGYVSHVHINDLDRSLYAFWWAVLNETEALCERARTVKITIPEWRRQQEVQRNKKAKLLDLGFSTFFLNRTNRSGIIDGGVIGGVGQEGNYPIDCRFNREDLTRKIVRLAGYKEQITLTNMDARDLLQRLNRRKAARRLINIDPPYFVMGRELYKSWYRNEDHALLARTVATLKANWMVTYDDTPETRKLYAAHRCFNQQLTYTAQVKRVGVELLVLDPRLKMPDAYRQALAAA